MAVKLLTRLLALAALCVSPGAYPAMDCDGQADSVHWIERGHARLSSYVCQQARWFDSFFAEPEESDLASSQVRLRSEGGFNTRQMPEYRLRLNANYHLPGPKKRWQLLFDGEESGQLEQQGVNGVRKTQDWDLSAALERTWYQLNRLDIKSQTGVRLSGITPAPFARLKYQSHVALSQSSQLEWKETLYWQESDPWRLRSQLNWEGVEQGNGYAWRNQVTHGIEDSEINWHSSVMKLSRLGPLSALRSYATLQGAAEIGSAHLGSHWRQNLAHSWLFFEIEPQLYWAAEQDFRTEAAIKLALEMQFGG